MPKKVEIPNLGTVEFPDTMSDQEIQLESERLFNISSKQEYDPYAAARKATGISAQPPNLLKRLGRDIPTSVGQIIGAPVAAGVGAFVGSRTKSAKAGLAAAIGTELLSGMAPNILYQQFQKAFPETLGESPETIEEQIKQALWESGTSTVAGLGIKGLLKLTPSSVKAGLANYFKSGYKQVEQELLRRFMEKHPKAPLDVASASGSRTAAIIRGLSYGSKAERELAQSQGEVIEKEIEKLAVPKGKTVGRSIEDIAAEASKDVRSAKASAKNTVRNAYKVFDRESANTYPAQVTVMKRLPNQYGQLGLPQPVKETIAIDRPIIVDNAKKIAKDAIKDIDNYLKPQEGSNIQPIEVVNALTAIKSKVSDLTKPLVDEKTGLNLISYESSSNLRKFLFEFAEKNQSLSGKVSPEFFGKLERLALELNEAEYRSVLPTSGLGYRPSAILAMQNARKTYRDYLKVYSPFRPSEIENIATKITETKPRTLGIIYSEELEKAMKSPEGARLFADAGGGNRLAEAVINKGLERHPKSTQYVGSQFWDYLHNQKKIDIIRAAKGDKFADDLSELASYMRVTSAETVSSFVQNTFYLKVLGAGMFAGTALFTGGLGTPAAMGGALAAFKFGAAPRIRKIMTDEGIVSSIVGINRATKLKNPTLMQKAWGNFFNAAARAGITATAVSQDGKEQEVKFTESGPVPLK